MPLEVKKKERENNASLVYRFTRSVMQSGIIREARSRRFYQRPLSNAAKKRAALRRERGKAEYKKMIKEGKRK